MTVKSEIERIMMRCFFKDGAEIHLGDRKMINRGNGNL